MVPMSQFSRHIWRKYFDERRYKKPPKPTKNVADLDSFFGFHAGTMVATQEILPEFNFIKTANLYQAL